MAPKPVLKVGFILARQFTLSAFANFADVLRLAADEGDREAKAIQAEASVFPVPSNFGICFGYVFDASCIGPGS